MIMVGRTHDAQNNHRKSHIFSEAGRPNNERIFAIFGDPLIVIFTIYVPHIQGVLLLLFNNCIVHNTFTPKIIFCCICN